MSKRTMKSLQEIASLSLKKQYAPGGVWEIFDEGSKDVAKMANAKVRALCRGWWRAACLFALAVARLWKDKCVWKRMLVAS